MQELKKKIALFLMPDFYKHIKRMGRGRIEEFYNPEFSFSKIIIISIGKNESIKNLGSITIIEIDTSKYTPRLSFWLFKIFSYQCDLYKKVHSIAIKYNVDIVIQRYGGIIVHGIPIVMTAQKIGIPSIVTVQNAYDESRYYTSKGIKRKLRDLLEVPIERYVLINSTKIWTVSNYLRNYVNKFGDLSNKIITIYNKTDDEVLFDNASNNDNLIINNILSKVKPFDNLFLSIGRLIPQKNYFRMIKAFEQFLNLGYNAKYIIIGQGPELNEHIQYLRDNDLLDKILIVTKYLNIKQLALLYQQADALLFCSLIEGQGRVVYESLAFGKPVIGSNLGPIPEMIIHKKNGYLVNPHSIQDILKALIEFSKEKHIYNSEYCKKTSERFFLDAINHQEAEFYNNF